MSRHAKTLPAFTITELSISMAFISMLLIAISGTIMYALSIYQKGVTIRNLNETSQALIDEISRSIAASGNPEPDCGLLRGQYVNLQKNKEACNTDSTKMFYFQQRGNVDIVAESTTIEDVPLRGFFCTGKYSYIWNSGYLLDTNHYKNASLETFKINFSNGPASDDSDFRFLRVEDSNRLVCAEAWTDGDYKEGLPRDTITISSLDKAKSQELLNSGAETSLAFYDFSVFTRTYHQIASHSLYSGSFILGTTTGSVDITAESNTCKEKSDGLSTDFAYCAINKFNFAVRAGGV